MREMCSSGSPCSIGSLKLSRGCNAVTASTEACREAFFANKRSHRQQPTSKISQVSFYSSHFHPKHSSPETMIQCNCRSHPNRE